MLIINNNIFIFLNQNKIIEKVQYVVLNKQIVLVHNLNIYFGNINNNKSKYVPEVMICCYNKNESDKINNELMNETININSIMQLTKRIDNNNPYIGLYNNTNSKVIIIQGSYSINKKQDAFNQPGPVSQGNQININAQQNQGFSLDNKNNNAQNVQLGGNNNPQSLGSNSNQVRPPEYGHLEMKYQIKIILNMIIDLKIIRKKRKWALNKNTNIEKYYLISNDWTKKFMEYYKLQNFYNDPIINKALDNIIFNPDNINILSNNEIIANAQLQNEFINAINSFSMNIPSGKYAVSISLNPNKTEFNGLFYYRNFSLVSENTLKYIKNYTNINNTQTLYYYCIFGDNKIIVCFNGDNNKTFLVKIYYLDNYYNILPEIFFKYNILFNVQ